MTLLYFAVFSGICCGVYYMIKYIKSGSPEKQREDAAYKELIDFCTWEASQIMGREITEKDILDAGRKLGKKK